MLFVNTSGPRGVPQDHVMGTKVKSFLSVLSDKGHLTHFLPAPVIAQASTSIFSVRVLAVGSEGFTANGSHAARI